MDSPKPAHSGHARDPFQDTMRLRWLLFARSAQHDAIFEQLFTAYTAPNRHYHNLVHVYACLQLADQFRDQLTDHRAVIAAIWFHDAVYDPTRSDNEERSADLAERHLRSMGQSDIFIAEVRDLIMDTRHQVSPESNDGQYLADIDLTILGAPPEDFDAYELAIRQEYAHVTDDAFRAGRAQILRSFLDRPSIYLTDFFRDLYEQNARANLTRSLATLGAPPPISGGTMPP